MDGVRHGHLDGTDVLRAPFIHAAAVLYTLEPSQWRIS